MMSFLESHDSPLPIETILGQGGKHKLGRGEKFLTRTSHINYSCAADTSAHLLVLDAMWLFGQTIDWVSSVLQ